MRGTRRLASKQVTHGNTRNTSQQEVNRQPRGSWIRLFRNTERSNLGLFSCEGASETWPWHSQNVTWKLDKHCYGWKSGFPSHPVYSTCGFRAFSFVAFANTGETFYVLFSQGATPSKTRKCYGWILKYRVVKSCTKTRKASKLKIGLSLWLRWTVKQISWFYSQFRMNQSENHHQMCQFFVSTREPGERIRIV